MFAYCFVVMQLIKLKQGNDSYVDRGMQTFNDDRKHKEVQVTSVETIVSLFLFLVYSVIKFILFSLAF